MANITLKPEWVQYLKTHKVEPAVIADYARYATMDPDDVLIDFMDCHKDWPYAIPITNEQSTYSKMLDIIAFADDESEYKDLPFAPYAPVIKDCYRPYFFNARITTPNTNLYFGIPGLKFCKDKPSDSNIEVAECEIKIMVGKTVTYKGYVFCDQAAVAQAHAGYLGPIKDKATALQFIKDHDTDDENFYRYICDGLGYYDEYPWLAQYIPEDQACSIRCGYLDDDPVIMCIDKSLMSDPDIINALKNSVHWQD